MKEAKNRYTIEVLKYGGPSIHLELEADTYKVHDGVIEFRLDGGIEWITIAIYPVDKTIISKIVKL